MFGVTAIVVIGSFFLLFYQEIQVNLGLMIRESEPQPGTVSNQKCADLFDKIFDTWQEHVSQNYGGPGYPILEPPTVAGLIKEWEGGKEFRNTDCRFRVNDWAYLARYQEQVWGHVDWPKLEPFSYNEPSESTPTDAAIDEEWPTGGILKYEKTPPIIDETYLSKTVKEWQDVPQWQLEAEHAIRGDEFYTELGRLLIKNEMTYQLQRLGIVNANDDFEAYSGSMLTSLPPHISYEALVNGTDGKTYRLQGGSFANKVNYYKTEELKFYDTAQKIPIESILTKPQLITILPEDGDNARVKPNNAVIHLNYNKIEFFNNSPKTVRIQDSGSGRISDEHELGWIGPTLKPNQGGFVTFNATGLYEWDVRTYPDSDNPGWWGSYAGGSIVVLSDDANNLSFEEKMKMAGTIIMESEIPWTGLGMGNNRGLEISFNDAIFEMLSVAPTYYEKRAQQLIPFDVPIIIEVPKSLDKMN